MSLFQTLYDFFLKQDFPPMQAVVWAGSLIKALQETGHAPPDVVD